MDTAVLTVFITTTASMITGVATWFASRKRRDVDLEKKKAEVKQKDAQIIKLRSESSQAIMAQYQNALDDLQKRYESRFDYLKKEYQIRHEDLKADYERKHERLKSEKHNEIAELKKEIESLRRNLELWKKKYRDLKKEIK